MHISEEELQLLRAADANEGRIKDTGLAIVAYDKKFGGGGRREYEKYRYYLEKLLDAGRIRHISGREFVIAHTGYVLLSSFNEE